MKLFNILCLLTFLVACAHDRKPSSLNGNPMAYGSMALGNIQASAVKKPVKQDVCFDIQLKAKGITKEQLTTDNWTLAWIDQKGHYHLLKMSSRHPASIPQGGEVVSNYGTYQEWSNTFNTCASHTHANAIKGLVLTPKQLPYKDYKGLILKWQE